MGSLQQYGKVRVDFTYTSGSLQSACSTGEEFRANSSGEATMSFCKAMKQPLADLQLFQPEKKETASEPFLLHTLKTSRMLEGDVPQELDDIHTKISYFPFKRRLQRTE